MTLELCTSFLERTKIQKPPNTAKMCLGSYSQIGDRVILHIRPHDFLQQVAFSPELQTFTCDVETHATMAFAYLECICRHLKKNTVYLKNINPSAKTYEVYV